MTKTAELAQIAISRELKNEVDKHCLITGQKISFVIDKALTIYLREGDGAVIRQSMERKKK